MLALRMLMRCNATATSLARTTANTARLFHAPASFATNYWNGHRGPAIFYMPQRPALLNGYMIQRRPFASGANDDAPVDGLQRVYYGTLAPRMKAVKILSLSTSLAGLAAQPILMEQGMKLGGTVMAVFLCGFAGFFTFVTPFLLHFITKKYVTEIHYNSQTNEYVATTISLILRKIQTKFRPSDVKVPEVPGMFTSFVVGKRALFVDPALFDDPDHYVRIMGYDKPIDFKLDLSEAAKEDKSK